jgi:hypothetical protein
MSHDAIIEEQVEDSAAGTKRQSVENLLAAQNEDKHNLVSSVSQK